MTAQLASTPLGEGMDSYGHWSYIAFFAREGRPPKPGELSMPADIVRLNEARPPASRRPGTYRNWAALGPDERQVARAEMLRPLPAAPYVGGNTQAQHPPFYYAVMSLPYRILRHMRLDHQAFLLSFISILVASSAFPALFLILRRFVSPQAALMMTACIAWFPNLMGYLGRITNDTFAFPLYAWLAYFLTCEESAKKQQALAGLALTLGIMTKSYFLTAVPVYFMAAAFPSALPGAGVTGRARGVFRAILLTVAVLLAPLFLNYLYSGHLVPMRQLVRTSEASMTSKLVEMLHVNAWWFVSGLAKGFFWSGFWSFVSPGALFYVPLLVIPLLFILRTLKQPLVLGWSELRHLRVHYAMILCFLAGLWVYAGLYRVDALSQGHAPTQGNEGWYLNVLFGSIAAILAAWCSVCFKEQSLLRILKSAMGLFIVWNLWARLTMIAFWSGLAEPLGRLRAVSFPRVVETLQTAQAWENWQSLPGVIGPGGWTVLLSLAMAIGLTLMVTGKNRATAE